MEQIQSLLNILRESLIKLNIRDENIIGRLELELRREIAKPPEIAVIGPAGVGKSSTINALFGTNLYVSNVLPGTMVPQKVEVERLQLESGNNLKGTFILYDMPGIGADLAADEKHKEEYAQIISRCDTAVWIMPPTRDMIATSQEIIRDIVAIANEQAASRLVIGINKFDQVEPGDWNNTANLPSIQQLSIMEEMRSYVFKQLVKFCPELTQNRVVPYSAKKHFRLPELFGAMLKVTPTERAWVLDSRKKIADHLDFVDSELKSLLQSKLKEPPNASATTV